MHGRDGPPPTGAHDGGEAPPPAPGKTADGALGGLLEQIRQRHGAALLAVLVYGSWLRGKRDTMLDFYVLVEDYRTLESGWQRCLCRLLPPNVYQIRQGITDGADQGRDLRAKYALLTLGRFCEAVQSDFHSYFWARFAQPCEVLYVRDEASRAALQRAFRDAANTFVRRVLPAMAGQFSSRELWTRGLSLTYQCELRTESGQRGESIYEHDPAYYDGIVRSLATDGRLLEFAGSADAYLNRSGAVARKMAPLDWRLRRLQGKVLSALRLFKAAFTFKEPLPYLLWKIERHSGIYIEPTALQLKHPLIFAWPLLWKLRRRGAFR